MRHETFYCLVVCMYTVNLYLAYSTWSSSLNERKKKRVRTARYQRTIGQARWNFLYACVFGERDRERERERPCVCVSVCKTTLAALCSGQNDNLFRLRAFRASGRTNLLDGSIHRRYTKESTQGIRRNQRINKCHHNRDNHNTQTHTDTDITPTYTQ